MVADKVTKMDAKMVIKSIFREQNVQLELVAGGCADDNVSSRLVGEMVDVVGMVADRQVVVTDLNEKEEPAKSVWDDKEEVFFIYLSRYLFNFSKSSFRTQTNCYRI